jgi:hypothetical protein
MTVFASSSGRAMTAARPGLLWSEYAYLLAVAAAAIVMVDPLERGLAANPVMKHLALMIALPSVLLTLIGRRLGAPMQKTRYAAESLRAAWPLFVLAVLIVGGSVHTRFIADIQNTFLNVGLYMTVTFCAAAMVMQTAAPEALLRAYFRILLVAAIVMGVLLIVNFRVRQVYHEQVFLVIPMAALFFTAAGLNRVVRWLGCAFFLSMAWFSVKYTSYLIGALTVIYLALAVALPRLASRPALHRVTAIYWSCVFMLLGAAILASFALRGTVDLPTGNPEYRLHTYAAAWERFTASPLWGTLFAAEAVDKFTPYAIGIAGGMLPTHSDVLDLLANGGIVAGVLWALGVAYVAQIAFTSLLHQRNLDHPWAPYGHTLALMSLAGVLTYAFNPILLQPSLAFLLWSNLGTLLGLGLRARRRLH